MAAAGAVCAATPAIEGYADYDAYCRQLERIAQSPLVERESLGTTLSGRDVWLLRIGTGKRDQKPAILIVGTVEPAHLFGSELVTRLARRLASDGEQEPQVRKILDRVTFYVIPRAAPDAAEAFFRTPRAERSLNDRAVDDDGDGRIDEDGPEDLDGNGAITMIRVPDTSGDYLLHPNDDRVLIEADPEKNERGRYALYVEGRDNDRDGLLGEDPAGGVALNRNFPYRYPYFETGAGPHQTSEVESRALADFAYGHPNIALVLTATPDDNLMNPWEAGSSDSSEPDAIPESPLPADASCLHRVAEIYQEIHGGDAPPEPPETAGSFSEWAYYHYGRWSFGFRGWWIPEVPSDPDESPQPEPDVEERDESEPPDEKRGADDCNALAWFAREKIDGFVPWKRIEHPDFPGQSVEVGGFRPWVRLNPPQKEFQPLADAHWEFLLRLVEQMPRVAIESAEAEPLGQGAWRVTAVVVNRGALPTMSAMGHRSRLPQALQIELELPKGVQLVTGHARRQLDPLDGDGGRSKQTWLLTAPTERSSAVRIRLGSPSVGTATKRVQLAKETDVP